jgi:hypothetical protein
MVSVPRLWPNSTIVCLGCGPSLTAADVALASERAKVIAINDTVQIAPSADVLYSSDQSWIRSRNGVPAFTGLKFSVEQRQGHNPLKKWPAFQVLKNSGERGLAVDPTELRTGENSGYAAINLAVHLGAARVVLLGYDMSRGPKGERHFDGDKGGTEGYLRYRRAFSTLVEPLAQAGVTVVNASRRTALTCFPRVDLSAALTDAVAA